MNPQKSLESALLAVGNRGRYQSILLVILCFIFYLFFFLVIGPSLYYMNPVFECRGHEGLVDQKYACPQIQSCKIKNDFTIVSYMGMYCDRQAERNLIQVFLSVGSMLGLLVMNFMADLKGRKLALISDIIIGIIGIVLTIIGAYAAAPTLLVLASFLSGFSGYSCFTVCYIMAGDFCEQQLRQKGTLFMNFAFSLGLVTFFFLYEWYNKWQDILVNLMLVPIIVILVISYLFIVQSPNYYLFKLNDKTKCLESLVAVARFNGKSQEVIDYITRTIQSIQCEAKQQQLLEVSRCNMRIERLQGISKQTQIKEIWDTLKQWQYIKIIIGAALTEAGGNLFYFGIQFAINDIGYDYGVDNLVLGLTEIATTLVLTNYITKLKRKKTILICYLLTALAAMVFLITAVNNSSIICTLLIVLIRFFTTTSYFMMVMIQIQSFPLEIQSIGAGAIEAFSQLGSIGAPLIIAVCINMGLSKMPTMGIIMLILMIGLIMVPEPVRKHKIQSSQSQWFQTLQLT